VGELAQLFGRAFGLVECLGHKRRPSVLLVLERPARQFERDDRVDQALLRAVVQIANHPLALLVGRRHDPCSRRRQIRPRLDIRDRRSEGFGRKAPAAFAA
jgi:hypothetical protein